MLLNLLNLFSLIIALFKKIYSMNDELDDLRHCKGTAENMTNATSARNGLIGSSGMNDLHLHDLSFGGSSTAAPFSEATAIYGILHAAINDLFPNIIPKVATLAAAFNKNVNNAKKCIPVPVNCSKSSMKSTTKALIPLLVTMNFTTTILPEITNQLNSVDFGSTTEMDLFSSTGSTFFYDTSPTNYFDNDTMMEDENSTYSMGSTTPLTKVDDYKATTPTPEDDNYVYDGKFVTILHTQKERERERERHARTQWHMNENTQTKQIGPKMN